MKSRKWKVVCIRLIFLQLETTRIDYLSSHSLEHRRWFFLSFSFMLRWCCKPCQRLRHKLFEEREALNVLSVGKGRITLQTVGCSLYLPKMHFPSSSPSCFSLDFFLSLPSISRSSLLMLSLRNSFTQLISCTVWSSIHG